MALKKDAFDIVVGAANESIGNITDPTTLYEKVNIDLPAASKNIENVWNTENGEKTIEGLNAVIDKLDGEYELFINNVNKIKEIQITYNITNRYIEKRNQKTGELEQHYLQ